MEETNDTLRKVDVLTIGHWPTHDHASKSQNMLEETVGDTCNRLVRFIDIMQHHSPPYCSTKSLKFNHIIFMDATAATRLGPFLGREVVTKLHALVLARPASNPFMVLFTGLITK